ncbi:hypothetical protein EIP91_009006 [Steccherinum ochraceum]|uniref:25S rRNA adenine-N(1) methyltransferase n=1 Tax=Steccherinum ochraceum TaxID=92696 RepID=A0A4R0R4I5_9APHY|nr:hypothetical protein EIP91_009006 [Steccherinum ochraceum]
MHKNRKTKKKTPVTAAPGPSTLTTQSSSNNPAATRKVIRRFHVLLKRQTQLKKKLLDTTSSPTRDGLEDELTSVQDEMDRMGGLAAYQRMSTIGQGNDRGGGSEKVLVGWLRELKEHERSDKGGGKLRLFEVGALKPNNYATCASWIHSHPIDLHSQHPEIQEQDFLLVSEEENRSKWDVISLSLVLNFVPIPQDRAHSMLREGGYLFVALPLPCILNSRYLTEDSFHELMEALSFKRLQSRWKNGGKMAYWLYQKTNWAVEGRGIDPKFQSKTVLRQGDRNNFSILL